jgi:uncharacterized GH25 family protein
MQRKVLVVVVALSVAFGAAAVAATDSATVEVEQEPNEPAVVTVTNASGAPVENASLTVELADGDQPDYDGTGNYTTDANGTVELPAPEETVDVVATGTVDNETVSTEATLEYRPELDLTVEQATGQPATVTVTADNETVENATVSVETVDANATYEGTGNYTTDANGTVQLPAPNETVNVTVSTEYEGASASTSETLEAPPGLDVSVEQDRGYPATVAVTADGESAANATVTVDVADENATYVGTNETYETDANGTVELPAPEETVTVTVTAALDGASASTEAELRAAPDLNVSVDQDGPGLPATVAVLADGEPAENATVEVDLSGTENTTYAGTGTHETDMNGTVGLPAPEETVTVTVTASYQGAEEAIVATVEGIDAIDESLPFGQQLQQFKATLDDDNRTGREIASWVTENNPGNAPDHAGPKGPSEGENATDGSDERGPPAHAGGNDDSESTETESDGNESRGANGDSNAGGNGRGNSGGNGPPRGNGNR